MQVDLPALERPTNAISGNSSGGKKCNCGAVVKNLAVCSQPNATAAAFLGSVVAPAGKLESGGGFVVVVIGIEGKPEAPL